MDSMIGVVDADDKKPWIFWTRLALALMQGLCLYLMIEAQQIPRAWPATVPALWLPLMAILTIVPQLIQMDLGHVRLRPLLFWAGIATLICAGLGYYDIVRRAIAVSGEMAITTSGYFHFALYTGLFIAHILVTEAVKAGHWRAAYVDYFSSSWKRGAQIILSLIFTGLFWGLLLLGAHLFKLIHLNFLEKLLEMHWFWVTATTMAFSLSMHVTDAQPALIRGARTILLGLMSWLLPLGTLIVAGFLASLPFTGLTPLWDTHTALSILLTMAGVLILLINSCYQDGRTRGTGHRIKQGAAFLAAFELVPLLTLAALALWLRIDQYGLTVHRVYSAALIILFTCYTVGYAVAALPLGGPWLQRLETTNLSAAMLYLGLVLALFTPIADPARLMVDDQVARLASGQITPEKFDFSALKDDGERWGKAALDTLAKDSDDPKGAAIKTAMTKMKSKRIDLNDPTQRHEQVLVYPPGRTLPDEFYLGSFWKRENGHDLNCFNAYITGDTRKCVARFVTFKEGEEAIVWFDGGGNSGLVLQQDTPGNWHAVGLFTTYPSDCGITPKTIADAIETGTITQAPHPIPDLVVGGSLRTVTPIIHPCSK